MGKLYELKLIGIVHKDIYIYIFVLKSSCTSNIDTIKCPISALFALTVALQNFFKNHFIYIIHRFKGDSNNMRPTHCGHKKFFILNLTIIIRELKIAPDTFSCFYFFLSPQKKIKPSRLYSTFNNLFNYLFIAATFIKFNISI